MTDINWQTVETDDGTATAVPTWLEELKFASAAPRKQALAQLHEALNHQATPTPGGVLALPLLLEFVFGQDHQGAGPKDLARYLGCAACEQEPQAGSVKKFRRIALSQLDSVAKDLSLGTPQGSE